MERSCVNELAVSLTFDAAISAATLFLLISSWFATDDDDDDAGDGGKSFIVRFNATVLRLLNSIDFNFLLAALSNIGDCWADKKLCSESSNDALADDITPDKSCIDGTSGSMSELSASNECFSLLHHGEVPPPPSDAVRYDERD